MPSDRPLVGNNPQSDDKLREDNGDWVVKDQIENLSMRCSPNVEEEKSVYGQPVSVSEQI